MKLDTLDYPWIFLRLINNCPSQCNLMIFFSKFVNLLVGLALHLPDFLLFSCDLVSALASVENNVVLSRRFLSLL
jgi:hypothetical protein